MDNFFLAKLDKARDIAGIPFRITSGYRCKSHNKNVKGVKNSAHTRGYGADIKVVTEYERYLIITSLLRVGLTRLGVYGLFIHVDCDPIKNTDRIWRG